MQISSSLAILLSVSVGASAVSLDKASAYTSVCERPAKVFRTSTRIVVAPEEIDTFISALKKFADDDHAHYYPLGKNDPGRVDVILSEQNGPGTLQIFNRDGSGVIVAFASHCGKLDFRKFWDQFIGFLSSYQRAHSETMHYVSEPIVAQ